MDFVRLTFVEKTILLFIVYFITEHLCCNQVIKTISIRLCYHNIIVITTVKLSKTTYVRITILSMV